MSPTHHAINYIELSLGDTQATQDFYSSVFGWSFQDWGPDYISFSGAGLEGGFSRQRPASTSGQGTLMVLYSNDLSATRDAVKATGRPIVEDIFDFPGGRRFHFVDPSGNEVAVWGQAADA